MDNVIGRIAAQSERFSIAAPFWLFAAFLLVVFATPALANNTFGIAKTDDLLFGSFVAGSGGTVVIAPSTGARSATDGVTLMNYMSTSKAASFTVSCIAGGTDNCQTTSGYLIALPSSATLTSGGNSMNVGTFLAHSANNGSASGRLVGGYDTLNVGATLTVGANQAPGSYTGSFSVTVTYQ